MQDTEFEVAYRHIREGKVDDLDAYLCEHPQVVSAVGKHGTALLHNATEYGAEGVDCLLKHGADPDMLDSRGRAPLHLAVLWETTAVIGRLVGGGADIKIKGNVTRLAAATTGLHDGIALGGLHSTVEAAQLTGWTPLHFALYTCSLPSTERLLDLGADVNAVTDVGITPLHICVCIPPVRFGREGSSLLLGLTERLLEMGADPNAKADARSLLWLRSQSEDVEGSESWPPLRLAAYFPESLHLCGPLLAHGATV